MRLLLGTHALLWYVLSDPRLSATADALILDPANEVLVSSVSYWEVVIKVSLGKLSLNQPYEKFLDSCINAYRFVTLALEPGHTVALAKLPHHHNDPFDRMLIAQALTEGAALVSVDVALDAYGVTRLW